MIVRIQRKKKEEHENNGKNGNDVQPNALLFRLWKQWKPDFSWLIIWQPLEKSSKPVEITFRKLHFFSNSSTCFWSGFKFDYPSDRKQDIIPLALM